MQKLLTVKYHLIRYKKVFLAWSLILFCSVSSAQAQERITPLYFNKQLNQHATGHWSPSQYKRTFDTLLNLPFIEDFSGQHYWPDHRKWKDRHVFVNNNFSVDAPSIGVATFDGLDYRGYPYIDNGRNRVAFCDELTSQAISLENIPDEDTVVMSFMYQQKGLGENPEEIDSLMLEFKYKLDDSTRWRQVWSVGGGLDTGVNQAFQQVILPIPRDSAFPYYIDSFQFRFRNFGNPTGALDHWHLDYIWLDRNRSQDTVAYTDFAIYQKPLGLLKTYTSMPWEHFILQFNTYIGSNIEFYQYNNWDQLQRPRVTHEVYDMTNDRQVYFTENPVNPEYLAFERKTWFEDNVIDLSKFSNVNTDEMLLEVRLNVTQLDGEDFIATNNRYVHKQHFSNYYAYDDGSAEGGYGIDNARSGGVALRFQTPRADTLHYIGMHFTSAREQIAIPQAFNLVVWKRIRPAQSKEEIVRLSGVDARYAGTLNGFSYYALDSPVVISGEFYVGWEQFNEYNFNIGFDKNYGAFNGNRPNPNLFYNALGQWEQSRVVGTPMIRPVFGREKTLNRPKPIHHSNNLLEINAYPNPFNAFLRVETTSDPSSSLILTIIDNRGNTIYQQLSNSGKWLINHPFPHGHYMVTISDNQGNRTMKQVIKN